MIDTGPSGVKRDDEWHAKQDIIRDGDPELEAKVLKRLKRDPIPFNVLQEKLDMDGDVLRALLMRLGEAGLAEIDYGFGWKRKAPRPKLTRKAALALVLDAAENWANELTEYIIPADEDATDEAGMDATLGRKQNVDDIYEAVKLLSPKEAQ
jgi:DNA-binding transcriptional ArsR family regulator